MGAHARTLDGARDSRATWFQDRRGRDRCRQVQKLLTRKLADVDGRLQQLQEFRRTLRDYLSQCERALGRATDEDCPVVRELSDDRS
jgi:DNA-binding transcriptional MerR regulator